MLPGARARTHLWAHCPEPLRQPLLKRVHANPELRDVSCQIFVDILPKALHADPLGARASQGRGRGTGDRRPRGTFSLTATPILRYMGDYPSRQAWTPLELTDQIFALALQDGALQDEVYCQILKQLTHNTRRSAGDGRAEGAWRHSSHGPPRGARALAQPPGGGGSSQKPCLRPGHLKWQWDGQEPHDILGCWGSLDQRWALPAVTLMPGDLDFCGLILQNMGTAPSSLPWPRAGLTSCVPTVPGVLASAGGSPGLMGAAPQVQCAAGLAAAVAVLRPLPTGQGPAAPCPEVHGHEEDGAAGS